jgi:hypothetical protein
VRVVLVKCEGITVVAIQSITSAKPDETTAILDDGIHIGMIQAVFERQRPTFCELDLSAR